MSWGHIGQFNDIGVIMKCYNVSEILHQPHTLDIYQDESQDNSPHLDEKGGHFTFPPKATEVKFTYFINIQFDSSPRTH